MTKKKLLMISLQEDEAKKVAQVISNENCRKILEHLADKEATESEIANILNIPISTAHYNLQLLIKSGLVIIEHFHYSKKGKEINHYKLANQYIIIAPKKTYGIKEKLKSILPVGIITIIGAGVLEFYSRITSSVKTMETTPLVASRQMVEEIGIQEMSDSTALTAEEIIITSTPNYALWFFIGGVTVIISYIIIELIKLKINNKRSKK
jgi:DNA-binding transcriptional ArsR family regulator